MSATRRNGAGLFLAAAAFLAAATTACSRNNIEAINLANEADGEKKANPDDALGKYQQAAQMDPDNHRILYKLALAYKNKESWSDEVATLAKAEAADKKAHGKYTFANYWWDDGFAMLHLARDGKGAWADAKSRLDQAVAIDPNYADAYFDRAEVDLHVNDDEQGALNDYTKAIDLKPDNTGFYPALGNLYMDLGDYKESEQVFKVALDGFMKEGDKNAAVIHNDLGNVYDAEHKVDDAIAQFNSALQACGQCTDHPETFFYLGSAESEKSPPAPQGASHIRQFNKAACKGAQAKKFADLCSQVPDIAKRYNITDLN
jgi:tetratricopeptide (TPR) repeat protein